MREVVCKAGGQEADSMGEPRADHCVPGLSLAMCFFQLVSTSQRFHRLQTYYHQMRNEHSRPECVKYVLDPNHNTRSLFPGSLLPPPLPPPWPHPFWLRVIKWAEMYSVSFEFLETHHISYGSARLSERCLSSVALCSGKSSSAFPCGCKDHNLLLGGLNAQNLGSSLQGIFIICTVYKSGKVRAKFFTRFR